MTKRILLGEITTAHGIRGEVVIRAYTADPADIASYGPLTDSTGKRTFSLSNIRDTGKGVHARIAGIATRTDAEALRGTQLYVARNALPPPNDGDYYHEDLVGLSAVTADGTSIGNIIAVQNFGAGDLLEIRLTGGSKSEFVPFTDTYAPTIDISGGRIIVVMPVMVGDKEPDSDTGDAT